MPSNTRQHPDALIPVGNCTVDTTNGAKELEVPVGASGIIMQNLATNGSYWSFQAMESAATGFKFGTGRETVWFNHQTSSIFLFLHNDDSIVYQFVAPVAF
jgi:hypothetical protein